MAVNISNGRKIYQHFQMQDPPKFNQIGNFGLEANHLASLTQSCQAKCSWTNVIAGLPRLQGDQTSL
jgi:hypothetical protein